MKWLLMMGLLERILTSPRDWIILLGSCKKKVQSTQRTQVFSSKLGFFALNLNMSLLLFLVVVMGSCDRERDVTLIDDMPAYRCSPPETLGFENHSTPIPRAKIHSVEPSPGSTIPSNQDFCVTFDRDVTAATVNGSVASRSDGRRLWKASPPMPEGPVMLIIEWANQDGSICSQWVGPYTVRDE